MTRLGVRQACLILAGSVAVGSTLTMLLAFSVWFQSRSDCAAPNPVGEVAVPLPLGLIHGNAVTCAKVSQPAGSSGSIAAPAHRRFGRVLVVGAAVTALSTVVALVVRLAWPGPAGIPGVSALLIVGIGLFAAYPAVAVVIVDHIR